MAILNLGNSNSAFSGSFSGSFQGDGSGLTNVSGGGGSAFPFTGDAQITGSLTITGSLIPTGKSPLSAYNVVIGREAGELVNSFTTYNVFVGGRAGGNDNDYGDQNVLVGYEAGYLGNQTGNTSIGYYAGRGWGTTGTTPIIGYNTSIGHQSAYNAAARASGTHNTLVGAFTGRNLTSGNGNIYIGYYAGYQGAANTGNIIIGSGSEGAPAYGTPINNQLRIGNGSFHIISGSLTTGDVIFASTASAAYFVGDGSQLTNLPGGGGGGSGLWSGSADNISNNGGDVKITGSLVISGSFIPKGAGVSHISNVSIGQNAGPGLTSGGQYNVIVGSNAGENLDDEDYGVFIGGQAARYLQYGSSTPNVIIGGLAGANLKGQLGVGANDIKGNVFLGYGAGQGGVTNNTMAVQNNVGIGYQTLSVVSGGQNNIALGFKAGASISDGDSNIIIGSGSLGGDNPSNQLRIGNGSSIVTISGSLETGDVIFASTASAAYFVGDGSQLTNLPGGGGGGSGLWSGSADNISNNGGDVKITGSLTISGSFHSFTLDSDNIVLGSGAGTSMQAGANNNVILGTSAGTSLTTGDNSVIIGNAAGAAVATDSEVVYIGNLAGGSRTGAGNIAIGNYAAQSSAASSDVIAIGRTAARYTTGGGSIAIGRDALMDGNTDVYNIAIGYEAGEGSTAGPNIAIGAFVLKTDGAGRHNTIIGHNAGEDIQGGYGNTMLGHYAGKDLQSGTGNIIIGSGSLGTDSPSNQLRIGNGNSIVTISGSLTTGDVIFASTASAAYFVGDGSGLTNVSGGGGSTFPFTGDAQITGSLLISGSNPSIEFDNAIIIGSGSGENVTTGVNNIIIGDNAGNNLSTTSNNVIIGKLAAGGQSAGGTDNVYVGYEAGFNGNNASYNVGVGHQSLKGISDSNGYYNVALGYRSGLDVSSGIGNVLLGYNAGFNVSTGDYNTLVGYQNAYNLVGGNYNTFLGMNNGGSVTGDNNIIIGQRQGLSLTSGNNNIFIGSGSAGAAGMENQLQIGISPIVTISASLATGDIIFYNTASAPNFSGSFQGDGSGLTGVGGDSIYTADGTIGSGRGVTLTDTLTFVGGTGIGIGTTPSYLFEVRAAKAATALARVRQTNATGDGLIVRADSTTSTVKVLSVQNNGANQIFNVFADGTSKFMGDTQISGSVNISGSGGLSVESSGSTVFNVIGSEGTLFTVDDDLDGTIFTANDRSGLPVLEASASGEVYIGKSPQSLYTTAVISSTTANISQSIYGLSTSSYGGVFVDYTANSGSNARAGSIMSVWNGSSLNFTETTTLDIGDTSNLLMQVAISQSQAQVQSYATTAGYNIKTIIRSI